MSDGSESPPHAVGIGITFVVDTLGWVIEAGVDPSQEMRRFHRTKEPMLTDTKVDASSFGGNFPDPQRVLDRGGLEANTGTFNQLRINVEQLNKYSLAEATVF